MMSVSDIVVIVLALISLLFALLAKILAQKALEEARKIAANEKALEMSHVEVPQESLDEIAIQLKKLPKDSTTKIINVKGTRKFPNSSTKIANYK